VAIGKDLAEMCTPTLTTEKLAQLVGYHCDGGVEKGEFKSDAGSCGLDREGGRAAQAFLSL
jgi:hypothetical protein